MKFLKLLGVISIAIVITACGSDIEGTYIDQIGEEVIFKSNGKVIIGDKLEFDYELDGNKIRVKMGQGKIKTLTIEEDGSISMGGRNGKLIKQKGAKAKGLKGTYIDQIGDEVIFKSNGKVIVKGNGVVVEVNYVLKGNDIQTYNGEIPTAIWTLEEDGSITAQGKRFVKQ